MAFSYLLKIALHDGAGLAGLAVLLWHGSSEKFLQVTTFTALSRAMPCAPAGSSLCVILSQAVPFPHLSL